MPTLCNSKPRRGKIRVASHFNGWYAMVRKTRAFRYATMNPYRVPTARILLTLTLPANELAGYPYYAPMGLINSANSALKQKQAALKSARGTARSHLFSLFLSAIYTLLDL